MGRLNRRQAVMDIGIFTIVYNGYGRYVQRWCESIAKSTVQPTVATVALFGERHGVTDEIAVECKKILPCLEIVHCGDHINIGTDRNKAVENTHTEWLMLLSADDVIIPDALEMIAQCDNDCVDVIATAYIEEELGGGKLLWPVPKDLSVNLITNWKNNWLSPYSVFRKTLWVKVPYIDYEFPNVPFVFDLVRNGARFARVDSPCVRYIRRFDSHARKRAKGERQEIEGTINRYARCGVIDIYQERYVKHQEAKKNMSATEAKPEYTDIEVMTVFKVMQQRRSQRLFSVDEIDDNRMAGVMKAASLAPSSCNRKAIELKIITDKDEILALSKLLVGGAGWLKNANKVILLMANMRAYKSPAEVGFMPYLDAAFIAQNIYLIGEALGIGVCFINPNIREADKKEFDSAFLPDGYRFCGASALGNYDLREAKHA